LPEIHLIKLNGKFLLIVGRVPHSLCQSFGHSGFSRREARFAGWMELLQITQCPFVLTAGIRTIFIESGMIHHAVWGSQAQPAVKKCAGRKTVLPKYSFPSRSLPFSSNQHRIGIHQYLSRCKSLPERSHLVPCPSMPLPSFPSSTTPRGHQNRAG